MHAIVEVVHVGSAFVWAGGAIFIAAFVGPAARAAGPGAGPFMGALLTRTRLLDVMTWLSILTVGAGIWLWVLDFQGNAPTGYKGAFITIGALAGISALGVALLRQRPTIVAMRSILLEAGDGPPSDEQQAELGQLRAAMTRNGNVLAVVVAIAIVGMAVGG